MAKPKKNMGIANLPTNYVKILEHLKDDIRTSRSKAALAVNRELIGLYWRVGQTIVEQQAKAEWGRSVVERLARDLKNTFPDIKGFSPANLWRMRSFYLSWTDMNANLAQIVRDSTALPALPHLPFINGAIMTGETDPAILAQLVRELPWGHNILLFEKIKEPAIRLWYLQKALLHGWSRNILSMQIESELHRRQGNAPNNFVTSIPGPDADLAVQTLKDPYNFDFLGLGDTAQEREIERALMQHIKRFLLELGEGFALVGQQYRLTVGDKDYYIDLLFYHIKLRSYVAVELKAGPFEPAYVGQLNHYLSALDDKLRGEDNNPAIGLILCRDKDKVDVEYALRDMGKPMAIADYKLTKAIPADLRGILPSIEEIEMELDNLDT